MTLIQEGTRRTVEGVLAGTRDHGLDETSQAWIDRMYSGSEAGAADQARASVESIMRSEGFVDSNRNWFAKLIEAYFRWRDKAFESTPNHSSGSGSADMSELLFILIIAAVIVFTIVLITRHFTNRRKDTRRSGTMLERLASRVEELRARARAAEAAGNWIEALRLDFFALVIGLGERGDLDYRDAWTNRELLERGFPSQQVECSLRPIVRRLDAHSFGHLPSGPEEVVQFREFCDRLLEGRA